MHCASELYALVCYRYGVDLQHAHHVFRESVRLQHALRVFREGVRLHNALRAVSYTHLTLPTS